jgi:cytolysin-activating lysine-acyltransferase
MDWKSGDNLWLMDMIAPFGGQDEAMKELREKVFAGRKIKTLQPAPSGEGMAVVEW